MQNLEKSVSILSFHILSTIIEYPSDHTAFTGATFYDVIDAEHEQRLIGLLLAIL